ncbi:MAG: DegT/DnrJ/EryC1/StrS family aminotransferase [Pseudomonadota bacterium]
MQFVDLKAQFGAIEEDVRAAMDKVLAHGQFIMGPEVAELESELAAFCGSKHVIATASGTDALLMALMAYKVGPGDAVIVPPFTFVATAEVVQLLNAHVVFSDVDESTFNMDPDKLEQTIERVKSEGRYNLKGIIPVDLFGLPADYSRICPIASKHDLFVLADCAQSFGARHGDQMAGSIGDIAATSFFPAKPLGCYGDGGAVFTDDAELADLLQSIRFHGKGKNQYDNVRTGITGRLDTLQAAVLKCKLTVFREELDARERVASRYTEALQSAMRTPEIPQGMRTAWAQYTVRSAKRDHIRDHLQSLGIPTAVYYPCSLHQQPAFADADGAGVSMPVSELLSAEVFSLPMHPYLTETDQDRIINAVLDVA